MKKILNKIKEFFKKFGGWIVTGLILVFLGKNQISKPPAKKESNFENLKKENDTKILEFEKEGVKYEKIDNIDDAIDKLDSIINKRRNGNNNNSNTD